MAFPTTSILDNFNRANEGPPPSANWGTPSGFNGWQVASNVCDAASVALGAAITFWSAASFGASAECYCDITAKPLATSAFYIFLRFNTVTGNGYAVNFVNNVGTDTVNIIREDGYGDNILASFSQEVTAGDSIGISISGSTITAWYKAAAGAWTSLGTASDATYSGTGSIGMVGLDTTISIDNFGGGTTIVSTTKFRKTLSSFGSATGKRQAMGWSQ